MNQSTRDHVRPPWPALLVMIAAAFMDLLDETIVQVALPSIQRNLHVDDAALQWTTSAYTLAFALLLVTGARVGDIVGRRRCFLGGLVGFVLSSAAIAGAQSAATLITFRALQGASAAMVLPQILVFIQAEFPRDERPKAFATYGMVLALAGAAGPLVGGVLIGANIAGLGWRAIFLVNTPVGIVALLAGTRLIPDSPRRRSGRLDPLGTLVLTAALLAVFYPLIEGRQLGWPTWAFVCLGASPILLLAFGLSQQRLSRRGGSPVLELGLLRSRPTAIGLIVTLAFFGATSFFFVLTLFLQLGLHYTPLKTGLSFLPFSVGIIIGSGAASPLGQRFAGAAVTAGTLLMTLTLASMIYIVGREGTHLAIWQLAPSLTVAGLAFGTVSGSLAEIILGELPERFSTSASGLVNTVVQLASVLAIALAGAIFFGTLGGRPAPTTFVSAARNSLWYLTASCAAATAISMLLPRHHRTAASLDPPPERQRATFPHRAEAITSEPTTQRSQLMTQTPVLTGRDIAEAQGAVQALLERILASTGTTSREYVVLRVLAAPGAFDNPASLHEFLAGQRQLDLAPDAIGELLSGLETRGLATGTAKDGPGPAQLTPKGAALHRRLAETIAPRTRELFSNLPAEDTATAHRVLRDIIHRAPAIANTQGA